MFYKEQPCLSGVQRHILHLGLELALFNIEIDRVAMHLRYNLFHPSFQDAGAWP